MSRPLRRDSQSFAFALIAAGTLLRLVAYWTCPSLGEDEASLAINIAQRDHAALLGLLSFDQSAPVGFLLLQRSMTQLLGVNEYALRLVRGELQLSPADAVPCGNSRQSSRPRSTSVARWSPMVVRL